MDPQKDPLAPQPGDDQQKANAADQVPGAPPLEWDEEAATTPAASMPVAGEKIGPDSSASSAEGTSANSVSGNVADSDTPEVPQQHEPSESTAPTYAGISAKPLPIGSSKGRKKGLLIGLIVAAVILLFSGGAAAAYFGYYLPNKPENVLKKALANLFDLEKNKTMHFSGETTIKSERDGTSLKTTYNGQMDQTSGAFLFSGVADALVTNITVEARSVDGKALYFKVGGLNGLAGLMVASNPYGADMIAPVIEKLNNQWIEVNEGLLKQGFGDSYQGFKLSADDARKLAAAYEQHQFIVIKEVLPDETIKGAPSHHYRVAYDKSKFKSFLRAANDSELDVVKLTNDQLKQLNQALDEADLSQLWDIWIGKGDKMLRQVTVKATEDDVTADARFTVDSYNQPVTVAKPENTMSILELMSMLFGGVDPALFETDLNSLFTEEFEDVLQIESAPSAGISL